VVLITAAHMARLKADHALEQSAVRVGCAAADIHIAIACSYPECKCKQMPAAIRAVLIFLKQID
jgi:hypothetical protein